MRSAAALMFAAVALCGCSGHPPKKVVYACAWDIERRFPKEWRDTYNPQTPIPTYMSDCMEAQGFVPDLHACPTWKTSLIDQDNPRCYRRDTG